MSKSHEQNVKPDIFDRIMHLPVLNIFEPFYKKNKEVLMYLFFGGLTFVISVLSYSYFDLICGWNELVANIASWVIAVLFAFLTNRVWVFRAPTHGVTEFLKQMVSFFAGRLLTLGVEEVLLFVFITKLHYPSIGVKVVAQVVVIVLNYIISKLLVFRDK